MIQISVTLCKRCGGNFHGVYFVRTAITSYSTLLLDHLFYFCQLTLTSGLSRQLVNKKYSKREDIQFEVSAVQRERSRATLSVTSGTTTENTSLVPWPQSKLQNITRLLLGGSNTLLF